MNVFSLDLDVPREIYKALNCVRHNVPRKGARLTEKIDLFILFYLMYILRFCAYSCMNNIIVYFKAEICQ